MAAASRAADRSARATRPDRRPRARDRQLLVVLALDHLLVDRRADDLLSRVRLRVRLARGDDRRPPDARFHRHGDGCDRGALLGCRSRHVRDVRQVPVPAHLRRDPRGAGRYGGARHRRGALDRDTSRPLRLRAAHRRHTVRARSVVGDAVRAGDRLDSRASAGLASGSWSPVSRSRSRTSTTS